MNLLFFNLIMLALYIYLGYFLLVIILGKVMQKKVKKADIEPSVALMIAAYNEELSIAKKIENSLSLDYPKDKFKIIVVSDGSTDRTDDIVKSYADRGVELIRVEGRVGKTEARNVAVRSVREEIIIFSDATTKYKTDIVRKLVRNFSDKTVGMVTGHLIYQDGDDTQMGLGQKLYWQYESLIKKSQTEMGTLTGSVGCVTAFRTSLYTPLPDNIIEDFTGPLMMVMKGFRVVYEEEAVCFEETTTKSSKEWSMRVRVIRGGMTGLLFARKILNPFQYPLASFQLISHKVLRWMVPLFMIFFATVTLQAVLADPEYLVAQMLLIIQVLFYGSAALAFLLEKKGIHLKITAIPFYFVVVNLAALVAMFKMLNHTLEATWEPQRDG
jgi:cellulose synthase/poly-beta-1,6-N-acetylglucosamine synthase-like glycosyltransferase